MKKSKTLKRFAAMLLAGTMTFAMGTSAFAAGVTENPTSVTLTKTVSADDYVKSPNTVFTFEVNPAGQETDENQVITAYAGIAGGIYFANGANQITFTPASNMTQTTALSLDVTVFEIPGIYHYTVKETEGSYDGMTYDSKTYDVYVYVENGDDDFEITAVESRQNGTKSDLVFSNEYETNKLTLTKVIEGNQSNKSKKFDFTVTINGADGEAYIALQNGTETTLTSGTSATFTLGNNESVEIYGLSENDTYTIEEADYSNDGYVATISGDGTVDESNALKVSGTEGTEDNAVTYTNTKEVSTPTGIITNVLPYVLMLVTAAGLALVFLRKREYDR